MKVSIITAVYNARETVGDAIESILAQGYPDIETIVIDGASTDGTLSVLKGYGERLGVLISEPDGGIYAALNKGISHASGDVIGFLHADDMLASEHSVTRIADAFSDPSVEAVYGDLVYVDKRECRKVIRYWHAGEYSRSKLTTGWMPPHPTLYVRRSVYERMGGFDVSFRIAADYDCMLRFLWRGGITCRYVPEVLVRMRVGGASNRSIGNMLRKSAEDYRAIRRHKAGGLHTLISKNLRKIPQFLMRERRAERKRWL